MLPDFFDFFLLGSFESFNLSLLCGFESADFLVLGVLKSFDFLLILIDEFVFNLFDDFNA